jgi:predicted deacylase
MIDKSLTVSAPQECYYFTDHKKILARESGFIRYDAPLGMPFGKGDRLFTLYPSTELGAEMTEVASEAGIMYKRSPTHIYRVGDETLHYIPRDCLKAI